MNYPVYLGLDIGTTSIKVVAFSEECHAVAQRSERTPWYADRAGGSCLDLDALYAAVAIVLAGISQDLLAQGLVPVGLGVTGMAETGVLLDSHAKPLWPAIAWYDSRGDSQLSRMAERNPQLKEEFSYCTGLPWDQQASIAKMAWLNEQFPVETGWRWMSIPELLAYLMTGVAKSERTLVSRTGLIDHDSLRPWELAFDALGMDARVLPEVGTAEMGWGTVLDVPLAPALSPAAQALVGATLTVAGHDHVVAAYGAGVNEVGQVFNSCGTADVILRVVERWPPSDVFRDLGKMNISMSHHMRPGQFVVNGGTKAGYVLRRITELCGPAPEELLSLDDDQVSQVDVQVPLFGDDEMVLTMRGEVSIRRVWEAALAAVSKRSQESMSAMEAVFGPYDSILCGGGWTRVDAVRRMKERIYHDVGFTDIAEPGCLGAAKIAMSAYCKAE